jgi:hypothetical protein
MGTVGASKVLWFARAFSTQVFAAWEIWPMESDFGSAIISSIGSRKSNHHQSGKVIVPQPWAYVQIASQANAGNTAYCAPQRANAPQQRTQKNAASFSEAAFVRS